MIIQAFILSTFSILTILFILSEIVYSHYQKRKLYSIHGTAYNLYLMFLNLGLDFLFRAVTFFMLAWAYQYHLLEIHNSLIYWLSLIILEDLMYYLLHLVDHYSRFFWAIHVTHHSSEEFNLTVGFRSSVFQPLYRFFYFLPLAFIGFKPLDILFMYSATQIWGILVHTKTINKLPKFIEYIFVTPSHHRVHHGSNIEYLDKNMGMLLIIWDRIFGTFQAELESTPVVYGLTKNIEKTNPIEIVIHEWKEIWVDSMQSGLNLLTRLKYIFFPPGWSHDGRTLTSFELRKRKDEQTKKLENK